LDFGSSTASIFDEVPPSITAVVPDCGQTEVVFTLSENVLSENLIPSNLNFTQNGNTIAVDQVNFTPGDYVHTFSVSTANFDQLLGPITLTFNNPPTDLCGNPLPLEYTFELDGPFAWDYSVSPSCAGENGSLEVSASGVDGDCFNMVMNNVPQTGNGCDSFTATGLNSGTYTVNLTSNLTGCVTTISIQVEDLDVSVDAGDDVNLCDLQTTLAASFVGDTFEWLPTAGVTFGNANSTTSNVAATTEGLITLTAQAGIDDCFVTDFVNVTFNFPPDLNYTTTEESCFGNCDGTVTFVNPLGNNMSILFNGQTLSGSDITFENLCQTSYPAVVTFSAQCIANYDIGISGQPEVVALFSATPSETSINNLDITLTSFSQNADTLLWEVIGQPELTSDEEVYEFTLPAIVANYPVQLTVTGPNGCKDTEVSYIIVRDEFQVYVPNSFSPNDDGINDVFGAKFSYEPNFYELLVFNRWGETVFKSNDPNAVWMGEKLDGSHYGEAGVYLWRLKVRGLEIETEEYEGTVTIIR
jgi:gliding motility-associated-like protein